MTRDMNPLISQCVLMKLDTQAYPGLVGSQIAE